MQILSQVPKTPSDDLLVGSDTLDDAGVFRLDADRALVQTLDFFPPIVDDPVWFGRIAAANSLSDVYAMGGTPMTVMNIVGFPKQLPVSILGEIMKGSAEKVIESGAVIVGGHSVQDVEIKFGLSVTGMVHPDRVVANAGAAVGDLLVLTKPLGMGAVSTAIKMQKLSPERVEAACRQMATLNHGAAVAMSKVSTKAGTDVTGFGLMGHARGMAVASDVTIELDASKLPVFDGALELAEAKLLSGGANRTRLYLADEAEISDAVPYPLQQIAFDAETSGGMLIAVPPDRLDTLLEALKAEKTPSAAVVGRVVERRGGISVSLG